jgi:SAM-dependent methyltransferase
MGHFKSTANFLKLILNTSFHHFSSFLFGPNEVFLKFRALPHFITNFIRYNHLRGKCGFPLRMRNIHYRTWDRFHTAGVVVGHYFHQDLWAAKFLYDHNVKDHVDVGSRIDGFIGHILPFCRVKYVDLRPLPNEVDNLHFLRGSVLNLPFGDYSVGSISCLHVLEHVGLGRYGDPVDPQGYSRGAKELGRVLSAGGILLIGVPTGRERLCFDAHRIFDPDTIRDAFRPLRLLEFHLIDDSGTGIRRNASFDLARSCEYGCGLYVFGKI